MLFRNTDREWNKWDKDDLYYAVLASPKYRNRENMEEFFASGEQNFLHMKEGFDHLSIPLTPEGKALDYGCGVGRVLRPFGQYFQQAVGIDVSRAMVEEAQQNINVDTTEVRLVENNDLASCLGDDTFSFIHTRLVLQHIPAKTGFQIIRQLLERLDKKGKSYIQAPMVPRKKWIYFINQLRFMLPFTFKLSELLLGKEHPLTDPVTEMNVYPAHPMLLLIDELGIEVRHIALSTNRNLTAAAWYLYRP